MTILYNRIDHQVYLLTSDERVDQMSLVEFYDLFGDEAATALVVAGPRPAVKSPASSSSCARRARHSSPVAGS